MSATQIHPDILSLVGNTPVVRINRLGGTQSAELLGKLESFNPAGSVKDRIALAMIRSAERQGLLAPGGTIIEPTSGNTGIGLAMVAAVEGYRLILVMPETMSQERRRLLQAYGAQLVLTPGTEGMAGAVRKAQELLQETPGAFMPQQFDNPANPATHRENTAREILEQTGGRLDAFVAGIGTGGTISGVGPVLKSLLPGVKIVGVEPARSPLLTLGHAGPHRIQGIGANFLPKVLDREVLDKVIPVSDEDALSTARRLAREEGLLAGVSSGAAVFAALQVAQELGPGKRVLVILPDTGERYLSVEGLFDQPL
ncbi:MAG: cysteine synthase A [Firmicutes bacterium]|nr:cysteine synthase A [Bacillota bacterium]